jgi:hypothetical protein
LDVPWVRVSLDPPLQNTSVEKWRQQISIIAEGRCLLVFEWLVFL